MHLNRGPRNAQSRAHEVAQHGTGGTCGKPSFRKCRVCGMFQRRLDNICKINHVYVAKILLVDLDCGR